MVPARALNWAVLFLLASSLPMPCWAQAELPASWSIAKATNARLQTTGSGAQFAVVQHAVMAGDVLVAGSSNLQPDFGACMDSCAGTAHCTTVNFCPQGSCPTDPSGAVQLPAGGCELRFQETAPRALGVVLLASGGSSLGDAGAKVLVTAPDPVPAGYRLFRSVSLMGLYDLHCPESVAEGICAIPGDLQAVLARCSAQPGCHAVVYRPYGRGSFREPVGILKAAPDGRLDPTLGDMNPAAFTLVKEEHLASSTALVTMVSQQQGQAQGGGGLHGVAVAGIAVGATAVGFAAIFLAAYLLRWRKARRIRDPSKASQQDTSDGTTAPSSSTDVERGEGGQRLPVLAVSVSRAVPAAGPDKAGAAEPACRPPTPSGSPTRILARTLFSGEPSVQWADLVVPRSQIEFCRNPDGALVRLGGGASGSVYRVCLQRHTVCACKVFDFMKECSRPRHFIQEASLLRRIRHPHVIQFFGVSMTEQQGLLLMELGGRDLRRAMHTVGSRGRVFGWYNRGHRTALQIASGLAYLHELGVVHLDLKPANVLVDRAGTAKVADVGFSKILRGVDHVSGLGDRCGTFDFCAPEVLLGGRASTAADIWSFGALLHELITGEEARRGRMSALQAPQQCPAEVVALQARCMSSDPAQRPSAAEILDVLHALGPTCPPPPQALGSSSTSGGFGSSPPTPGPPTPSQRQLPALAQPQPQAQAGQRAPSHQQCAGCPLPALSSSSCSCSSPFGLSLVAERAVPSNPGPSTAAASADTRPLAPAEVPALPPSPFQLQQAQQLEPALASMEAAAAAAGTAPDAARAADEAPAPAAALLAGKGSLQRGDFGSMQLVLPDSPTPTAAGASSAPRPPLPAAVLPACCARLRSSRSAPALPLGAEPATAAAAVACGSALAGGAGFRSSSCPHPLPPPLSSAEEVGEPVYSTALAILSGA